MRRGGRRERWGGRKERVDEIMMRRWKRRREREMMKSRKKGKLNRG